MRILLALDGSPEADRARALAASIDWPAGSIIDVVAVVESPSRFGRHDDPTGAADPERADLERVAHQAERALGRAVDSVRSTVVRGRPASVIVDRAAEIGADLIVVGSRGFGPIPTMVLGSVSAEVVDRAPCPVLVARHDAVDALVVGVDGSGQCHGALDFLTGFRVLRGRPVTVVSVMPPVVPLVDPLGGVGFGMYEGSTDGIAQSIRAERVEHEAYAGQAAEDLRRGGFDVTIDVREGDPAHTLIELAAAKSNALVVVGTHGRTGLTRVVLGSVARNVLLHASASVLVVRGPVRERLGRPVRAAAAVGLSGSFA